MILIYEILAVEEGAQCLCGHFEQQLQELCQDSLEYRENTAQEHPFPIFSLIVGNPLQCAGNFRHQDLLLYLGAV